MLLSPVQTYKTTDSELCPPRSISQIFSLDNGAWNMGRMEMGRRGHLCCEWRVHASVSWSEARAKVLRSREGGRKQGLKLGQ